MKKGMRLWLAMGAILAFTASANAAIVVDDWTLDLSGIDGIAAGTVVSNIEEITFTGIAHATVVDTGANVGVAEVGERFWTDGFLRTTGFNLSTGFSGNLPTGVEMTFDFSVAGQFISQNPATGTLDFVHIVDAVLADGILDVYIDNLSNNNPPEQQANTNTGDGFRDGVLIGSFRISSGAPGAGTFTPLTFDGADNIIFEWLGGIDGVWKDSLGDPLDKEFLLVEADSNFDADPTNQGNFSLAAPTNWGTYFANTGAGTQVAFFAREDGSGNLALVPEPSTLLLLGAGLLGLGALGRKRMK